MIKQGSIYLARNMINGKIYIGQTIQEPKLRISQHKCMSKTNDKIFYRAIRKYGFDNFMFCWLHLNELDKKKLNQYEKYYIWLFNSQNSNIGYNRSPGGDFQPLDVPEYRENHRIAKAKNRGKDYLTPEGRKIVNESLQRSDVVKNRLARMTGESNPMKRPEIAAKFKGKNNPMCNPENIKKALLTKARNRLEKQKEAGQLDIFDQKKNEKN